MHVGLFCGSLPGNGVPSGIVSYVIVMRQALIAAGHRVTVVTVTDSQTGDTPARPTAPRHSWRTRLAARAARLRPGIGAGAMAGPAVAAHFADLHANDPFDIIEMEESFGWSEQVARALPVPVVTRLHGPHRYGRDATESPADRRISDRRERVEGRSIACAAAITCPSARLLEATLTSYAITPRLAEVIPNPMPLAAPAECWSAERCDPNQILHLGRFDSRKGADVAIAAFAQALRTCPDLRLVIAGPDNGIVGADGSALRFDAYIRTCVAPEVRPRLDFRGPISREEAVALRLRSAVSLIPSRFENFAYSVAEAMAAGAPTVASDSFGNAEMIEDGVSGRVVPVGNATATAQALVWMIRHPERAAEMGARLRARCAVWLDPVTIAAQTVRFYERAIAMSR